MSQRVASAFPRLSKGLPLGRRGSVRHGLDMKRDMIWLPPAIANERGVSNAREDPDWPRLPEADLMDRSTDLVERRVSGDTTNWPSGDMRIWPPR